MHSNMHVDRRGREQHRRVYLETRMHAVLSLSLYFNREDIREPSKSDFSLRAHLTPAYLHTSPLSISSLHIRLSIRDDSIYRYTRSLQTYDDEKRQQSEEKRCKGLRKARLSSAFFLPFFIDVCVYFALVFVVMKASPVALGGGVEVTSAMFFVVPPLA